MPRRRTVATNHHANPKFIYSHLRSHLSVPVFLPLIVPMKLFAATGLSFSLSRNNPASSARCQGHVSPNFKDVTLPAISISCLA